MLILIIYFGNDLLANTFKDIYNNEKSYLNISLDDDEKMPIPNKNNYFRIK